VERDPPVATRGPVLWRVSRFTIAAAEAVHRDLAQELGTDRAAVACSQLTRLPGFVDHKYEPPAIVWIEYAEIERMYAPADFPRPRVVASHVPAFARATPLRLTGSLERARG
jgi:RepB DNA-primase from phage plasmid